MARKLFEFRATRRRGGDLASGIAYIVWDDEAATVLADISTSSGGSSIAGATVTTADIPGLGPAACRFYGPTDDQDTLWVTCPSDPTLGVQRVEASTDARLDALEAGGGGSVAAHSADTTAIHGITDTAQLALRNAVNTFTTDQYFKAGPFIDVRPFIAALGTAPGVDATNDVAGINAAIDVAFAAGGGDVWVPPISGGYKIKRRTTGQQLGGGIFLRPRVNLRGRGTKLVLEDNCHFIWCVSTLSPTKSTITANTVRTDTVLTVNSTTAVTVGGWVIVEIGQAAYDAFEPDWWLFAKVTAKTGTTITLDRPVGYALTVAGVSDTDQRAVTPITEFLDSNIIDGFELIDPRTGAASAEGGIFVAYAQSVAVSNIVAEHPGAGVFVSYYSEGHTLDNLRVRKSVKQGGQASKGRVLSFAETRNVHARNIYGTEFEGTFCLTEARSEGIVLDSVHVENTYPGRTNDTTNVLFSSLGNAKGTVRGLHLTGRSAPLHTADSTGWRFDDPVLQTDTMPRVDLAEVLRGRLVVNLVDYREPRRFSRAFRLPPSATILFPLPSGLIRTLRIRVSSITGITYGFVGTGTANTSGAIHGALVAGQSVEITAGGATGIGAAFPASTVDAKELVLTTDGTIPAGAWGVVEAEIWVKPGANDTSRGLTSPYDYVGVEVQAAVGAAATDAATTQTLANNLRTALINLGIVQS